MFIEVGNVCLGSKADIHLCHQNVCLVPNAESLGIACGVELRAEPDQGLGQLVEYREKLVAILNRQGRALKCSGLASP